MILTPVRYPIDDRSRTTLECAVDDARDEGEQLIVLHVDLFQEAGDVSRKNLRSEVERVVGEIPATYVVRQGFLVERSILEEAASHDVDTIVIGESGVGPLRKAMRRITGNDPDIEAYLDEHLDVEIAVAD